MEEMSENELREEFHKDWSPKEWYTVSQIAIKLNTDRRTVMGWNNPGLRRKDGHGFIILNFIETGLSPLLYINHPKFKGVFHFFPIRCSLFLI